MRLNFRRSKPVTSSYRIRAEKLLPIKTYMVQTSAVSDSEWAELKNWKVATRLKKKQYNYPQKTFVNINRLGRKISSG